MKMLMGRLESTWLPPQAPQAMSTPITEIPKSTPSPMITQDRVPLLTPMMLVSHPKEGETSTSSSTLSDPSVNPPCFTINRANVRAASSVSSLEEGEGIINDDEYERACLLYTSPSPRDATLSRMPSSA